ncbi:MAG: c-type cytochrome [Phycisphaerales bacterium]|nr:c-type cytochrome [Phycisphaerales bacterium]
MRRQWTIPALLATSALTFAGCDWMPGKPTEADKPVIQTTITNFHVLWTTHCSGCHGADGRWGAARPLNDPMYLAIADQEYVTRVVTDGVGHTLMPPFGLPQGGPMTDEQIKIVVDGMWEHWSNPAVASNLKLPSISGDTGSVSRGKSVFGTYCGSCHGDQGNGGLAGSVVDPSYLALVSDQALRSAVICGRLDLGMPNFAGYAGGHKSSKRADLSPLTDRQISDVVAWLASHRVEFPGQPYPDTTTIEASADDDRSETMAQAE